MYTLDITQPQLNLLLQALTTHEEWLRHAESLDDEAKALIAETGHKLRHCPDALAPHVQVIEPVVGLTGTVLGYGQDDEWPNVAAGEVVVQLHATSFKPHQLAGIGG